MKSNEQKINNKKRLEAIKYARENKLTYFESLSKVMENGGLIQDPPVRPERKNVDGSVSTHVMQSMDFDDVSVAYPTIFPIYKTLPSRNPQSKDVAFWIEEDGISAMERSERSGELRIFNNPSDAQAYAEGSWKQVMENGGPVNDNEENLNEKKERKKIKDIIPLLSKRNEKRIQEDLEGVQFVTNKDPEFERLRGENQLAIPIIEQNQQGEYDLLYQSLNHLNEVTVTPNQETYDGIGPKKEPEDLLIRNILNDKKEQNFEDLKNELFELNKNKNIFNTNTINQKNDSISEQSMISQSLEDDRWDNILNNEVQDIFKEKVNALKEKSKVYENYYMKYDSNPEKVKEIQQRLLNEGYYENLYDKNTSNSKIIDGKFGPKTKQAYDKYIEDKFTNKGDFDLESVNSVSEIQNRILSSNQRKYYIPHSFNVNFETKPKQYNEAKSSLFKLNNEESGAYECVQGMYKAFNISDRFAKGLHGSAWEVGENLIKNNSATEIFNGHTSDGFNYLLQYISSNKSLQDKAKKMTIEAHNSLNDDMFEVGDVLELYYHGSSNFSKAFKESNGKKFNTHAGWITEKDGVKYVTHNVGYDKTGNKGKYYTEKLEDVLKRQSFNKKGQIGVLGAYRPNEKITQNKTYREAPGIGIRINPEKLTTTENIGSDRFVEFYTNMAAVARPIQLDFNLSEEEMELVLKISSVIPYNESRYGNKDLENPYSKNYSPSYHLENLLFKNTNPSSFLLQETVQKLLNDEWSLGMSQIRMSNISSETAKRYGITRENLFEPSGSSRAAMVYIASTYNYLKEISEKYPELGLSNKEVFENVLWYSYNADVIGITQKYINNEGKFSNNWSWMSPENQEKISEDYKRIKHKIDLKLRDSKGRIIEGNLEKLKGNLSEEDFAIVENFLRFRVGYVANYNVFFSGDNKAIDIDAEAALNYSDELMSENIVSRPTGSAIGFKQTSN